MKTAIYIEDGVVQLVLTPESEFEKNAIASFQKKPLSVEIFAGAFYDCRGGWTRQTTIHDPMVGWSEQKEDNSVILRIKNP
tara:strand:+ start:277 stop:519 length:243 start_codon:yes stop_codon:yes gene_type:complete